MLSRSRSISENCLTGSQLRSSERCLWRVRRPLGCRSWCLGSGVLGCQAGYRLAVCSRLLDLELGEAWVQGHSSGGES